VTAGPAIGALIGGAGVREGVARQLRGTHAIRFIESAREAARQAAAGELAAVISDMGAGPARSFADLAVSLTAQAPDVPLVVYDRMDRPAVDRLRAVLVPGLRVEYVVKPLEPLRPVVEAALAPGAPRAVAPLLLQRLLPLAPRDLHVFVAIAAFKAASRRGVEQLAAWSGASARTIERRCTRAGWSAPVSLLQALRALDAVWLITEYGWSLTRIARARGLPSASTVTRQCERYCGCKPSALRESGGMPAAIDHAVEGIVTGRWRVPGRRDTSPEPNAAAARDADGEADAG